MSTSLKSKAKSGIIWTTIESISVQLIQFIIGVILARLLLPSDFGLIGILAIFFAFSQTIIDSGLEKALVQKNDRTNKDYSTAFVFNLLMSIGVYIALFFLAPYISIFFNIKELILLTRVLSIIIIINAIAIVQRTRLTIKLDFKTIARVNFLSTLIGGAIAIYFAYNGFGIWALVIQQIVKSILSTILFWLFSKWTVSLIFYKNSFIELFGYGFKLLIAGLYAQVLNNIYNIAIGKKFPTAELGFYTKAKGFTDLTSGTIAGILQQVTFPVLASVNNDNSRMLSIYRRAIQLTSFFIFPLMTLLALLADPIIKVVLGEKWIEVIPLLEWMVFTRIIYPISAINTSILNAMGRPDLFLKLDLSKFPLIALALIISIPLGVKAMVISQVVVAFFAFFMNAYLPGKYFGYGALGQLKDMLPTIITTILMAILVFSSINYIDNSLLKIIIGSLTALASYLLISYLTKNKSLKFIIEELKTFKN